MQTYRSRVELFRFVGQGALAEAIRSVGRDSVSLSGDGEAVTRISGITGIPVGATVSVASGGDVAEVTGVAERKP